MKRLFHFQTCLPICILISLYTFSGKAQTIIPAEMPVSYDVSPSGAFNYSLPIEIPPGIKDMVPNLAINYSSQGANTNLGVGWSLSGLSAITRTLPTIFHDKLMDPIDLDDNDILVLDGQRLIFTGLDGSGNTTFMTEIKNFAKITGHVGSGLHAPVYFTVEYPNGLIYEYGHSANSKLMPNNGQPDALMWAVNKISDRSGNYIQFDYISDTAFGQLRITDIYYSQNSNLSLDYSHIYFHYTSRNDPNKFWINGSELYDIKLLDYIEIWDNNGDLENRYECKYDGAFDFYSHLTEINEIRYHPDRMLPPITINWGKKDLSHTTPAYVIDTVGSTYRNSSYSSYTVGDYNNDGATDVLFATNGVLQPQTFFSDKQGGFHHQLAGSQIPYSNMDGGIITDGNRLVFDYNGDGLDDWIMVQRTDAGNYGVFRLYAYLTIKTSQGYFFNSGTCILEYSNNDNVGTAQYYHLISQVRAIPGDFDGDGKKDIILMLPTDYYVNTTKPKNFACFLVGDVLPMDTPPVPIQIGDYGSLNFGKMRWIGTLGHEAIASLPLDYDGDGKDDLLITQSNQPGFQCTIYNIDIDYSLGVPNSMSTMTPITASNFPNVAHETIRTGDFNGDGKTDLLAWGPANSSNQGSYGFYQWNIAYSTGSSSPLPMWDIQSLPSPMSSYFTAAAPYPDEKIKTTADWTCTIGDFNGDGKDDILQLKPTNVWDTAATYELFYARGHQHFIHESAPSNTHLPEDLIPRWNMGKGYFDLAPSVLTGDFNGDGQTDLFVSQMPVDTPNYTTTPPKILYFHPKDIRHLVTSIEHAGKRLDIEYKSLAENGAPYEFVPWSENGHTQTEYPYISRQLPLKIVSSIKDNVSLYNTYKYQTLSTHLYGLGMLGFHKTFIKDSVANRLTINNYSLFPFFNIGGDYTRSQVLVKSGLYNLDPNGNITDTISTRKSNWSDMPGGANGMVRIIKDYNDIETNYAMGTYHDIYQGFSSSSGPGSMFYEFGQIDSLYEDFGVHGGYNNITKRFTYDANAPFHIKANPVSVVTQSTYAGKATYIRQDDYKYNAVTGLLDSLLTDPGTSVQNVTSYKYDIFGHDSLKLLFAAGLTPRMHSYEYGPDGRFLIKSRSYLGSYVYEDSVSYNGWGLPLYSKGIDGLEVKYEYDAVNRVTTTISPELIVTRKEYDWAYNNSTDNPASAFTDYQVITANQSAAQFFVKTTTDGITGASYTFLDFYGRKLRGAYPSFDGSTIYKDNSYTATGLTYQTTAPYPKNNPSLAVTTTFYYDKFDRDSLQTSTSGPTIRTAYVASVLPAFLTATVTNTSVSPAHIKTTYKDAGGVYLVEDNDNSIETHYNSNGQPDDVTINGNTLLQTSYTYDSFGRVLTKTEPNSGTTSYTYDAFDQVITEEMPFGAGSNTITYTYGYDDLGRITSKTDNDPNGAHSFTYVYQNIPGQPSTGKLSSSSSDYGTNTNITYDYSPYGRLENEIKDIGGQFFTTHYIYDNLGRLEVLTYPDNRNYNLQNSYNQYGFLESKIISGVGITPHTLWRINSKNHLGQTTEAEYDNQQGNPAYTIISGFDINGYPTTKKLYAFGGGLPSLISSVTYDFDKYTSNLSSREDLLKGFKEEFTYDVYDRLRTVTPTGFSADPLDVQYDNDGSGGNVSIGNIVKKSDITSNSLYKWKYYGYALQTVPDDVGGTVPLSSVRLPNLQTLEYYPFKKLKYLAEDMGDSLAFAYDADEMRRQVDYFDYAHTALKTRYYADNYEKTIDRVNLNTMNMTSYLNAGGGLIALIREKKGIGAHPPAISFVLTDHLGSITHLLREDGSGIAEERSFDTWGRPRDPATWQYFAPSTAPAWTIDRGYTGHEHIWLSGGYDNAVINMNGRLYDPLTARMFSPDPVLASVSSSQAYNKYSYAYNNPLKYIDPSGNTAYSNLLTGATVHFGPIARPVNNYSPSIGTQILQFGVMMAAAYLQIPIVQASPALGYAYGSFAWGASKAWMTGGSGYDMLKNGTVSVIRDMALLGLNNAVNQRQSGFYEHPSNNKTQAAPQQQPDIHPTVNNSSGNIYNSSGKPLPYLACNDCNYDYMAEGDGEKGGKNMFHDTYTGDKNPIGYDLPPKNARDAISLEHDQAYDLFQAVGLKGLLLNGYTIPADYQFISKQFDLGNQLMRQGVSSLSIPSLTGYYLNEAAKSYWVGGAMWLGTIWKTSFGNPYTNPKK